MSDPTISNSYKKRSAFVRHLPNVLRYGLLSMIAVLMK